MFLMKNMFKRSLATVIAVASLAIGMTGIATNATDVAVENSIAATSVSNTSFSFNAASDSPWASNVFWLTGDSFRVYFQHVSSGSAATVRLYRSTNGSNYGGTPTNQVFTIPVTAGTSLSVLISPPGEGNYYWVVTTSGASTSGSFSMG